MDPYTTGNHGLLRKQNLAGTIRLLYENAPISRVDLARLTGLNKTTVSSLIDELIENQFVLEVGIGVNKGAGRRKVLLDVNPARGCILSAEIAADFVSVICTDFGTKVIWRGRESTVGATQEETISLTARLLREAAEAGVPQTGPILGLSLGVPGLVDQKTGTLLFAPN
ncbi:MAG: ROK family transcriptional regulator, partial [Blastocatellia bacterium]